MQRWLSRGAVGVGLLVGSCYAHSKYRENFDADISHTKGAALPLTAFGNAVNWTGSVYGELTGKPLFAVKSRAFVVEELFDKEVEAYCSDMTAKERLRIVEQYKRLIELFCEAENNIKSSPFSPLGQLVRLSSVSRYTEHREKILEYCTEPEHSFIISSTQGHHFTAEEELLATSDPREKGTESQGLVDSSSPLEREGEELRRRSLPVDADNGLLVVTGMHRTGSTLLQRLLALDPNSRSPVTWEMMQSVPPVESRAQLETDERLEEAKKSLALVEKSLCPNIWKKVYETHKFSADEHEEDLIVLMQLLVPFYITFWHQHRELIDSVLNSREYHRYKCRFLHVWFQMAASNGFRPTSHWITKNPDHAQYLDVLLEEFPRANIVVTHRDPKNVVASWSRILLVNHHYMIENKYKHCTPEGVTIGEAFGLTPSGLGKVCVEHMLTSVTRMMAARDRIAASNASSARERFFDVCFSELMKDPVGVVRDMYAHFGYDFTEEFQQLIVDYMAEHPRHKHGKVRYSLDDLELSKESVDESFADYRARFGKFF